VTSKYHEYHSNISTPEQNLTWNMYGPGQENIGRNDQPEIFTVPEPDADQMLVRVDSVGLCFSDVKLIRMGSAHPKLYNRNLVEEPTRLGHEAALTIIKVGKNLEKKYAQGQRIAVQPDIYQQGKSTAYGYTIPGGLVQYHLIGAEMLETDEGACLLPVNDTMGYAEASLLEPWGCVLASYTQRRRLTPEKNGIMWILGQPRDTADYLFSSGLDQPGTIVISDVPSSVEKLVNKTSAKIIIRNQMTEGQFAALATELTGSKGFDDIVMLDPFSAATVSTAARHIARRGTLNLVGKRPLDGLVNSDVGRLHYDYVAFIGNQGPDIADSYGEQRNRCELHPDGTAVFVGAGGPMGQMHVQRALELPNGPKCIIATEISDQRLAAIKDRLGSLAKKNNRTLITFNPTTSDQSIHQYVMDATNQAGADDVVVCVPVADVMAEACTLLNKNGMMVFFAGVPNGTMAPLNLDSVYISNTQYTGTSGLTLDDQRMVLQMSDQGNLSPGNSVGAIGGMNVAKEGIQAMIDGSYSGKIIIFPQLPDLPLTGLNELKEILPEVASKLGLGNLWTIEAEQALFETYWKKE